MASSGLKKEPMDPQERLKLISNFTSSFEVDPHIPPARYYRSGVEMIRMAKVYHQEGNLENAFMLYMKYMTLFLEKIRKHPDFNTVPLSMRSANQQMLRDVIPKAETLKQQLLQQYMQEYQQFKNIKAKEEAEARRLVAIAEQNAREAEEARQSSSNWDAVIIPPRNIDSITYPESAFMSSEMLHDTAHSDLPSAPTLPSTGGFEGKSNASHPPVVDRASKPSIPQSNSTINLRTVVIPSCLATKFLMLAGKNTLNNIETCGILAGILEHNQLIITHLIVPKQKGSSDSCTTTNEEEIFDLQDQFGLITIGWIHTHPTQTAFLSSVDLHTHCPYQLLMPEAIAIVCAPKYNDNGIFILTPNYGLDFIANCRSTGFHPHPTDPPLFMPAVHIKYDPGAGVDVIDLRGNKPFC